MAGPNRGCHPRAASERHEIADSNHGSHDGYLGGADQKPDDGTVCDAFEAKILARRQAGRRLAWRRCYEADEGPPQSSLTLLRPQLGTKEIDEWIKQPPRQLPQILSTARWS